MHHYSFTLACGAVCLAISACGGGGGDAGLPPPTPVVDTKAACTALAGTRIAAESLGLPSKGASVDTAAIAPASDTNPAGEYCLVTGKIASVDPNAQSIRFNIALPTTWNGKAMHLGGGAWDGYLVNAAGASSYGDQPMPLARGYATFGTDGGHSGEGGDFVGDARFSMNDEMLRNFGGEQLKKMRDVAMTLIKSRYGAVPSKTYYMGDSGGGHEGMVVLQRYAQDYDGIIVGYPALSWTPTFMKLQLVGRAMRTNGGAGWISQGKSATIRAALLQACDSVDGAADNIIANEAACNFNYNSLLCPGGGDTGDSCLSSAQLNVLKLYVNPTPLPYKLANDIDMLPGFGNPSNLEKGSFVAAFGSTAAFNAPAGGGSPKIAEIGANHWFGETMVRSTIMRDLNADTLSFDPLNPDQYLTRLQAVSSILDATNPDIQPFIDRKGKIIIMHGTVDPLIPAQATIDYYKSLVNKFGQSVVNTTVRLYLVPGYAHASGMSFNATGGLPLLQALERWVEKGEAPADDIVSTDKNIGAQNRTRPLCRYPTWAKYKGAGDVNIASSFECVAQ